MQIKMRMAIQWNGCGDDWIVIFQEATVTTGDDAKDAKSLIWMIIKCDQFIYIRRPAGKSKTKQTNTHNKTIKTKWMWSLQYDWWTRRTEDHNLCSIVTFAFWRSFIASKPPGCLAVVFLSVTTLLVDISCNNWLISWPLLAACRTYAKLVYNQ